MMLLFAAVLLLQDSISSDTSAYKTYYMEGIEITAERYTKFPELSTMGIDIIDKTMLWVQNPKNAGEALFSIPGISVLNYTVKNETRLGIRGFGFERSLIMIDGTPLTNPWDNSTILNEIPLYKVKRMEVIKGSSTVSYGPNTLGGVVNILTEDITDNEIQFEIERGNFDYQSHLISAGYDFGIFKGLVSYHNSRTDGFIFNTDHKGKDIGGSIQMGAVLRASFRYHNAVKGALGQKPGEFWRFPYWKTYHYDLVYKSRILGTAVETRYFRNDWKNELICYRDTALTQEKWTSVHNNQIDGGEVIANRGWSRGMISGGIQINRGKINTTNEGEGTETIKGVFLNNLYEFTPGLLSTLSFRYDIHSRLKDAPGFNIGVRFEPIEKLVIRANYGKVFAYPSLRQLYDDSPPVHTNPDLKPEKSTTFEMGVEIKKGSFTLKSLVFNTDTKDLIGHYFIPGDTINEWRYENIEMSRSQGWETIVMFDNQFSLFFDYMDARDLKTNHILEFAPKVKMGANLSFNLPKDISIYGNLVYIDKQWYQDKTGWDEVSAHSLCDAGISYSIRERYRLSLRCNNVFNTVYEIKEGIPGSPREYRGGASIRLY